MSATIPDTMTLQEITKATSGVEGGMSAGEINEMVTRLIADKQDKKRILKNTYNIIMEEM